MLELPEIVKKLQKDNLNKVSMDTHINYHKVWRIKAGKDCNPGYRIVKALSDYFLNKLNNCCALYSDENVLIESQGIESQDDCISDIGYFLHAIQIGEPILSIGDIAHLFRKSIDYRFNKNWYERTHKRCANYVRD